MNILILGSGGREHAIANKIYKDNPEYNIYISPGNGGTERYYKNIDLDILDGSLIANFCLLKDIGLVIVGPEIPLLNGVVDVLETKKIKVFGPSKAAARIEGSKEFAKKLMDKYNIPTAEYKSFDSYETSVKYVKSKGTPIVVKFDGLAAGKGVEVCSSIQQAEEFLYKIFIEKQFGSGSVIIEEFLDGQEFSLMAFVNGEKIYPMELAQDHKRIYDGDKGPNTGGMGAYSPVDCISKTTYERAINEIMKPISKAMVQEGTPFRGILYGGLIDTKEGPKVIEFNARFGDPETEVILPRMKSNLIECIEAVLAGKPYEIEWHEDYVVGVTLSAMGYPNVYKKGHRISYDENINHKLFHMGTELFDGKILSKGGRVLFVIGQGKDTLSAKIDAYNTIRFIEHDGLHYRKDISNKSLKSGGIYE